MKILAPLLLLAAASSTLPAGEFPARWSDGKAEISLYEGHVDRYGHARPQELQITVVKEPFHRDTLVKAEAGGDLEVLKLHAVQAFSTGTYDYHRSWSAFVPPEGPTLKETAVSVDGCGTTFTQVVRPSAAPSTLQIDGSSYWEGEARVQRTLDEAVGVLMYDALPLTLRLGSLEPTSARMVRVLPSRVGNRLGHLDPVPAELRVGSPETIRVPAGAFRAVPVHLDMAGQRHSWWFDAEAPHVLVRHRAPGTAWELRRTFRLDYWNHTDPGDEALLR